MSGGLHVTHLWWHCPFTTVSVCSLSWVNILKLCRCNGEIKKASEVTKSMKKFLRSSPNIFFRKVHQKCVLQHRLRTPTSVAGVELDLFFTSCELTSNHTVPLQWRPKKYKTTCRPLVKASLHVCESCTLNTFLVTLSLPGSGPGPNHVGKFWIRYQFFCCTFT